MKRKLRCMGLIPVLLISIALCACREKRELVAMTAVVGDKYMSIEWEGRTYVPFCAVSKGDCGAPIGYLYGDKAHKVCEYKDYPPARWIVYRLETDCGAMLLKEANVADIPDGLESEYDWNR